MHLYYLTTYYFTSYANGLDAQKFIFLFFIEFVDRTDNMLIGALTTSGRTCACVLDNPFPPSHIF